MQLNVSTFEKNGNPYVNARADVTLRNVKSFGFQGPSNLMATLYDGGMIEFRNVRYFDCFELIDNADRELADVNPSIR